MSAKTKMETLKNADWDKLEKDVVDRIRMLRALVVKTDSDPVNDAIASDLILPNITLLAEFCENIDIEGGDE
jgi:hypothetical protein